VERTKVGKNLPIYTEFRNGGNTCYTLIKRISGDTQSLSEDLLKHFVSSIPGPRGKEVVEMDGSLDGKEVESVMKKIRNKWKVKTDLGHIWVHGKHSETIRTFLESKGF
jgi:translation initiation factor 1 (eIF-1/SUI1)